MFCTLWGGRTTAGSNSSKAFLVLVKKSISVAQGSHVINNFMRVTKVQKWHESVVFQKKISDEMSVSKLEYHLNVS